MAPKNSSSTRIAHRVALRGPEAPLTKTKSLYRFMILSSFNNSQTITRIAHRVVLRGPEAPRNEKKMPALTSFIMDFFIQHPLRQA